MGYYNMPIYKDYKINFRLAIYNLFDRLNENWVNSGTGRAYTAVIKETDHDAENGWICRRPQDEIPDADRLFVHA